MKKKLDKDGHLVSTLGGCDGLERTNFNISTYESVLSRPQHPPKVETVKNQFLKTTTPSQSKNC